MSELTHNVKIAELKILHEIAAADNIMHENEVALLCETAASFEMEENYKEEMAKMATLQALSVIYELPSDQKDEFAKLMGRMIIIDNDINYNELRFYNVVCDACKIGTDFCPEEYPECSLSGDFDDIPEGDLRINK